MSAMAVREHKGKIDEAEDKERERVRKKNHNQGNSVDD